MLVDINFLVSICIHVVYKLIENVLVTLRVCKRNMAKPVLLLLSFGCLVAVHIPWLFPAVPWVGLQFVIVVFPDNTHLRFGRFR